MDELLYERVTQLEEIDERLRCIMLIDKAKWGTHLLRLRDSVRVMIEVAKAEHEAF